MISTVVSSIHGVVINTLFLRGQEICVYGGKYIIRTMLNYHDYIIMTSGRNSEGIYRES